MKRWKNPVLFFLGGAAYVGLELLWRGRSHSSMFLAGGTCFLLLGRLNRCNWHPALKCIAGSGIITAVELLTGLLVNRDYSVWDYRGVPLNFMGQICGKVYFTHNGREILNHGEASKQKAKDYFGEKAVICFDGMTEEI